MRLAHNRENQELANGSKINFDYTTFEQRSEIAKGLVTKAFGTQQAEQTFGDLKESIPLLLGRFVAGHEDAHNILEREDTYKVMGMQNHIDLDEAKADLASMITCLTPGFLDHGTQENLLKVVFAEELRGLSRWDEQATDRSHLNGNIILVQLMLNHGIVQKNAERWVWNPTTPEKIQAMRQEAKDAFLHLADVYEATDAPTARNNAEDFKEKYVNIPSRELLLLLSDAGILSEKDYAENIQRFYLADRRSLAA